jgi:hypothetical protein
LDFAEQLGWIDSEEKKTVVQDYKDIELAAQAQSTPEDEGPALGNSLFSLFLHMKLAFFKLFSSFLHMKFAFFKLFSSLLYTKFAVDSNNPGGPNSTSMRRSFDSTGSNCSSKSRGNASNSNNGSRKNVGGGKYAKASQGFDYSKFDANLGAMPSAKTSTADAAGKLLLIYI